MALTQIILSILGGLVVIGVIIWQIVISAKEEKIKDLRENAPRFKNFGRRDFTNGHFEGLILKEVPYKNGCVRIDFYPTDTETIDGKIKKASPQSVVYHRNKLKRLARGVISSETEQVWGLYDDFTDIPEEIRTTKLGQYLDEQTTKSFLENRFGNRVKNTLKASASMIEDTTELGVSKGWAEMQERQNIESRKIALSVLSNPVEENREEKKK